MQRYAVVSEIKSQIESNLHDINPDMVQVCFAIIDHVAVGPIQKAHLTFHELHRISPKTDDKTFYDAVFYLTRKKINVLTQNFEALDRDDEYTAVDREAVLEAIRQENYFNPHTGQSLTEEEFGEQVLTYFSPAEEFVRKLDD